MALQWSVSSDPMQNQWIWLCNGSTDLILCLHVQLFIIIFFLQSVHTKLLRHSRKYGGKRNKGDRSKVDLLRSLPNAHTNLVLFQADLLNPSEFEPAIRDCEMVIHIAHPTSPGASKPHLKHLFDAAVGVATTIADICIRLGTVKRLIYTGSVTTMSPLNEDGTGYRSTILDESTWTSFDAPITNSNGFFMGYIKSKTLVEKELLKYNEMENTSLEVVSLDCSLVLGETILPDVPQSIYAVLSIFGGDTLAIKFLQELTSSIHMVHVEDACEAHIFCLEKPSMKGRFLCSAANLTIHELAAYFQENFPELQLSKELGEEPETRVVCDNSRLIKMGFEYKHDIKSILDDTVRCGRRLGFLSP